MHRLSSLCVSSLSKVRGYIHRAMAADFSYKPRVELKECYTQIFHEGAWRSYSENNLSTSAPKSLKFLQYNIWFEPHRFDERGIVLRNMFRESDADAICLQEVTRPFLSLLVQEPWVQQNYQLSDVSGSTFVHDYAVVMLVKKKHPCKFFFSDFSSQMGRRGLFADLKFSDHHVRVATSHLESMSNATKRLHQMEVMFPLLSAKHCDTGVIMGDFNFDPSWLPEQSGIDRNFCDHWSLLHPGEKGDTMPKSTWFAEWRPDRVLSRSPLFAPEEIKIVGTEDIVEHCPSCHDEQKHTCTPSDHYGLMSTISQNKEKAEHALQFANKQYDLIHEG